jgi:pseudouridine-5'-phosphate glycosidase
MTMSSDFVFSPEVRAALDRGGPVVALESTLITHGLPYPVNVETARALEQEVRAGGATPATVAILKGRPQVGLDAAQLEYLGRAKQVRKCSRRDLPIVLARGLDGATTVAGTMLLAHRAGIARVRHGWDRRCASGTSRLMSARISRSWVRRP